MAQPTRSLTTFHTRFLALLPQIETHGRIYFRHVKCPHAKADVLQDMRAMAWKWFVKLARKHRNVEDFIVTFCRLLARAVGSGRRVTRMNKAKDVMGPMAKKRQIGVLSLCDEDSQGHPLLDQALQDNTQTPPPDQVAFRLDFPAWLTTRTDRDRRVIEALMVGERTLDVSNRYGLSPGRVSQLRTEFQTDWDRFCADSAV